MWFLCRMWLSVLRLLPRARRDLVLENLALRHQLGVGVYQRSQRRPDLTVRDRRFWSTLAHGWSEWRGTISIVQADTVVRCIARRGDATGPGRAGDAAGATAHRTRGSRVDHPHGPRESNVGCGPEELTAPGS
jgi:hypothetical protein